MAGLGGGSAGLGMAWLGMAWLGMAWQGRNLMTEHERASALGKRLDRRRRALGFSVARLGARAGYHENTVLRVLHGQNVRLRTIQDVATALGLSLSLTSHLDEPEHHHMLR